MAKKKEDIRKAIEAGPPPAAPTSSVKFVGVPSDYVAIRPGGDVPPRYRSGFEFAPAAWGVEQRARLQDMLDAAGLYDPSDVYQRGVFDPEIDGVAFKRLLTYSNASGQDFESAVVEMGTRQASGKGRRGGAAGAAARADVTNADDLRILARRVAKKSIGKSLDDTQMANFVKAYQGMEQSGLGGMPSAEGFMETQVEKANPKEVFARKYVEKFNVVNDLFGGGGLGIQAAQPGAGGGTQGI